MRDNDMTEIKLSCFGTLPTIVFVNHAIQETEVFICRDNATFVEQRAKLEKMEHISIVTARQAIVK